MNRKVVGTVVVCVSFHLILSAETTRIWAVNAGNATRYGDFAADANTGAWYAASAVTNLADLANPAPAAVYQSGKWSTFTPTPFTYTAEPLKPLGQYVLRLHHNVSAADQKFSVTVNGEVVETAYDKYAQAGNRVKVALIPEYPFQATAEGRCVVTFDTVQPGYHATLNGIEVVEDATNNLICPAAMRWPQPVAGSSPAAYTTGVNLRWSDQVYGNLLTSVFTIFRSTNDVDGFTAVAVVNRAFWSDADTLRGATNRYFVKQGAFAGAYAGTPQTNEWAEAVIPLDDYYGACPYRRIWAVNCGSPLSYGAFAPDTRYSGTVSYSTATVTGSISVPGSLGSPAPTNVYQNARYTTMASPANIDYTFPVLPNRLYRFRLHFCEAWSVLTRQFNIAVNGITVTNNYCVAAAAGGGNIATVFECDGLSDTNGQVRVSLIKGAVDNPLVCGIEVVEPFDAPPMTGEIPVTVSNAWESAAELRPTLGNTSSFSGTVWRAEAPAGNYVALGLAPFSGGVWADTPATGLETNKSYRYVVRADGVTPDPDVPGAVLAGFAPNRHSVCMGATSQSHFAPPDGYVQGASTLFTVTRSINLTGVTGPAPLAVYQQQRWSSPTLTFLFTNLHAGATYRMRLHGAETAGVYGRTFKVEVNGTTVCDRYGIAAVAGGLDRAAAPAFDVSADGAGRIELKLTRVTENPLVGGIEIRATPVAAAPAGLALEAGSAKVVLSWQPVVGADGYAVYRTAADGEPQEVGRLTGTVFTDASGVTGTDYTYAVRAFNELGEGPTSAGNSMRYPARTGTFISVY